MWRDDTLLEKEPSETSIDRIHEFKTEAYSNNVGTFHKMSLHRVAYE